MGIVSFIKEAGEKLFDLGGAHASTPQAGAAGQAGSPQMQSDASGNTKALNDAAGDAIKAYIESQGLKATALTVTYEGSTGTVTVYGVAPDQQTKEKIILCCGNVKNVAKVVDQMSVEQGGAESKFYTVVKGDTLSKVSKEYYGDANQYNKIFEANKPMLKSPDLIYPGQVLRIPQ